MSENYYAKPKRGMSALLRSCRVVSTRAGVASPLPPKRSTSQLLDKFVAPVTADPKAIKKLALDIAGRADIIKLSRLVLQPSGQLIEKMEVLGDALDLAFQLEKHTDAKTAEATRKKALEVYRLAFDLDKQNGKQSLARLWAKIAKIRVQAEGIPVHP